MIVYIKTLQGECHIIEIESNDIIYNLKKKVELIYNIDPIYQILIYAGKLMKSYNIINDYISKCDNPTIYYRVHKEKQYKDKLDGCEKRLSISKIFNENLNHGFINEYFMNSFIENQGYNMIERLSSKYKLQKKLQEKKLTLQYLHSINENGDNINEEINKIQSNLIDYN